MIRVFVELLCQVAERVFGCSKVRYQGIKKGVGQAVMVFGLVNLWQACKQTIETFDERSQSLVRDTRGNSPSVYGQRSNLANFQSFI